MNKKFLAMSLAAALAVGALSGCGEDKGNASNAASTAASDFISKEVIEKYGADPFAYNPADFVELGNIDSFDVELDETEYEYRQEDFDALVQDVLDTYIGSVKDESQTVVKEDSIVNIDYVGKLNGEAFQGGTASGQEIDVAGDASHYIDGFTAALIGHKVGDTFDAPLKFPETYGNADLAGKDTVFTMTVNYICSKATIDNVTNTVLMNYLGMPDKDEFLKTCEQIYEAQRDNSRTSAINTLVIDKIIADAKVKAIPEDLKNSMVENQVALYTEYAESYQVTLEEFVSTLMGSDLDTMRSELGKMAEKSLTQELIMTAAADVLGIEIDEAEFEQFVKDGMSAAQVSSVDTYLSQNCTDTKTMDGYSNLRKQFRCVKAMSVLVERANVITK